jgi:3-hydroxyisobutyrate dehydrogenase-like beta-hydroxyacid dehydrogenase
VGAGQMGAGLGADLRLGGARVVTTLRGRSARTERLVERAGLETLPSLDEVVAQSDVVLVVTPPAAARDAAGQVAESATRTGARPLVADLNAVSPETMDRVAGALAGFRLADGAISGPPPTARPGARLFLSGPGAADIAALPWDGRIEPVVVGGDIGSASAVKMCTASVYKGLNALVTQALRTAGRYGVLDPAVADLARNGLDRTAGVPSAATKAHRFVDEMREIAATQAGAGLTAHLFEAFAEVYADIAGTSLATGDPETAGKVSPSEVVKRLSK